MAEKKTVECEKIEDLDCKLVEKMCSMVSTTVIDSPGFTVLSPVNEDVKMIMLAYNKNIQYLPENLFENFPALRHVDGAACSIKQLSKATFRNLFSLEQINLDGNLIERIEGDTFDSLKMLKKIFLSKKYFKYF